MKFIAFRIDNSTIKNHEVVDGIFVRGQQSTDYSWLVLGEFSDVEKAKAYIRTIRNEPERQTVYGPDGYGINV